MSLNPFAEVKDYPSMRTKLGLFTFFWCLGAILLIQNKVPTVAAFLAELPFKTKIADIEFGVGTVLTAFGLAAVAYVGKLHDRISDLFRIRARFDVNEILKPLAIATGATLSVEQIKQLRRKRLELMGPVFYQYASSGKPVIDPHYITMALTQWSWYWVIVELNVVVAFAAAAMLAASALSWFAAALGWLVLSSLFLQGIRADCVEYALQQVQQIVADSKRSIAIADVLRAI